MRSTARRCALPPSPRLPARMAATSSVPLCLCSARRCAALRRSFAASALISASTWRARCVLLSPPTPLAPSASPPTRPSPLTSYAQVGFTDQSILNAEHRGECPGYATRRTCNDVAWKRLPLSYNVNVQLFSSFTPLHWTLADVAVVHFKGDSPWSKLERHHKDAYTSKLSVEDVEATDRATEHDEMHARQARLWQLWRRSCTASLHDDNATASPMPQSKLGTFPMWNSKFGQTMFVQIRG